MTKSCRLCGAESLELLRRFGAYPIFIGCTDEHPEQDEIYDFEVYHCHSCDVIQQVETPPLHILYRENRAFGLGEIWQEHYQQYFEFIDFKNSNSVLEVGGGNGIMLERILKKHPNLELYDIEPNAQYELADVRTIAEYFDKDFNLDRSFDIIYSSHLVEHLLDVNEFFAAAKRHLNPKGSVYSACPNIEKSFENGHLNAFTTDHFNYFTPFTLSKVAERHGLKVTEVKLYRDHGMYLRYQHTEDAGAGVELSSIDLSEAFSSYDQKIKDFARHVARLKLSNVTLFGAHAFTITFIYYLKEACGGELPQIDALLDNEPTKANRRLTGTPYISRLPDAYLPAQNSPTILLYMGAYTAEISKQLHNLNPDCALIRLDTYKSE